MLTIDALEKATFEAPLKLTREQAENIFVTITAGDDTHGETLLDLVEQTIGDALESLPTSTPADVAVSNLLDRYNENALYDFAHFAGATFEVLEYRFIGAGALGDPSAVDAIKYEVNAYMMGRSHIRQCHRVLLDKFGQEAVDVFTLELGNESRKPSTYRIEPVGSKIIGV